MRIESHKAQKVNNYLSIEIIRMVKQISSTKMLKRVKTSMEYAVLQEHRDRPMNIMEIAEMLDISDVMKILSVISDADMNSLAAWQIKEAFSAVLDDYTGVSSLEE
jgi:phosphoribosylanthranilate isomerase